MQARKMELNLDDQSNIRDDVRTPIDALGDCNVLEHRCVEEVY
jgi:hypothetical protein